MFIGEFKYDSWMSLALIALLMFFMASALWVLELPGFFLSNLMLQSIAAI
jgi:hypothetical protein